MASSDTLLSSIPSIVVECDSIVVCELLLGLQPWQGNLDVSRIPSFAIMLVGAAVTGEGWSSVATPVSWYGSRKVGLRLQPWRLFDVKLQNAIAARKPKEESRKRRNKFRFGLTGRLGGCLGGYCGIVSTVVTRPQPHNQAILHRVQGRVLTIRENARVQGFPDYYKLFGPVRER
uniref:DNA (Cytosine-5)-methyltransferase CMT3 isoform X1 n=1 Tax=Tanacetum cinerariifolium TaxID=118510 RepID=A0A699K3P9_TANCI|nr:DNA (cytosine-5)-methyltransferase CMT3 isoform X1 [Tanacetum cinerariifolium]